MIRKMMTLAPCSWPRTSAYRLRGLSSDQSVSEPPNAPVASGKKEGILSKYKALLVDVGGTLLLPAVPVEETYAAYGAKYGVSLSSKEIRDGFKKAFSQPWKGQLRYEGDGKPFWRYAVAQATRCDNEGLFDELYQYYSTASAWTLPQGAIHCLSNLKQHGVKLGVISNFDTRLRPLLLELNIANLFDCIVVSCEVGYEKPAPQIFMAALKQLDMEAYETILLGNDPIADKEGAEAVGIHTWLWRKEIHSFDEVARRLLN